MDGVLFKEMFYHLVQISLKRCESESFVHYSLPTFIDHEEPKIPQEESATPFVPSPPPCLLPNKMVPHIDVGIRKSIN